MEQRPRKGRAATWWSCRRHAAVLTSRLAPQPPEVEHAARRPRQAPARRGVREPALLHPALRRALDDAAASSLAGRTVVGVERRGKHQLLRLDDGRTLHAHFRMAGDWTIDRD